MMTETMAPAGQAAERTAVYRLFGKDEQLLYVGISTQPRVRFRQHERDSAWWPQVTIREIEWSDSRVAAEDAEKRAIQDEQPLHNLVHNGRQYRYGRRRFQASRLHPIALEHFGSTAFSYRDLTDQLGVPSGTVVVYGNRLVEQGLFRKVGRRRSGDGRERNHFVAVDASA
ncbi:GIY-YIG nuclease family protein [Streptomyces sp. NPDC047070]|uniref:GIY-YIG nuclease family protein n=1 Tax=Streptomyces sp. NPDC047070 TaxID=3154923 RepID=UPI00345516BD